MKRTDILIVEDTMMYATMAKKIFEEEYMVYIAQTGEAAVEMLEEKEIKVGLILLDLILPGMSGFDFLEYIQRSAEYDHIPIIVTTTESDEANVLRALELGAIDFITKPYNPEIVRGKVNNVCKTFLSRYEKLNEYVQEKEFQLQNIANTIPGGIATYEVKDEIHLIRCNAGYKNMFGYTAGEDMTKTQNMLDYVHPEDVEGLLTKLNRAAMRQGFLEHNCRIRSKDGNYRNYHLCITTYFKDGSIFANGVIIDITTEIRAVENYRQIARDLRYQARHDRLTGIYNEWTFYNETDHMLHSYVDERFVMIYVDIDHFKVANDLLGVKRSNLILERAAETIKAYVNEVGLGTYGRINGDKFAFCITEKAMKTERLIQSQVVDYDGLSFQYVLSLSYGIYYITDKEIPIIQMCDRAALVLKTIKGNIHRYYAIYDDTLRNRIVAEQQISSEMRVALENREFEVYYQPIYDANTDKIVCAESLIRWKHPKKGMIAPSDFIPLFEKNGFVVDVERFVRQQVLELIENRTREGLEIVPLSVNVSRVNFYNPKFCDELIEVVEKYQVDKKMIRFEITETACTEQPEKVVMFIDRLRGEGFEILMDDFGSGYSSLNMLKEIELDVLKIDMKFLQDIESSKRASDILAAVISMAKKLHMDIIAEGVETKGQCEFLKENGCVKIQGYYYSRPVDQKTFLKMLDEQEKEKNSENCKKRLTF